MKNQKLLSSKEVSEYLTKRDKKPMSLRAVQFEITKGYIDAKKIGGAYVIDMISLKNYKRRLPGVAAK